MNLNVHRPYVFFLGIRYAHNWWLQFIMSYIIDFFCYLGVLHHLHPLSRIENASKFRCAGHSPATHLGDHFFLFFFCSRKIDPVLRFGGSFVYEFHETIGLWKYWSMDYDIFTDVHGVRSGVIGGILLAVHGCYCLMIHHSFWYK